MKGKAGGKIETQNQNRRREKVARGEWKKGVARAERRDEGRDQRANEGRGWGGRGETGAMRLERGGLDVGRPERARTTALGRDSASFSSLPPWTSHVLPPPPLLSHRHPRRRPTALLPPRPCQPRPSISSRT